MSEEGKIDLELLHALGSSYCQERSLTTEEREAWPIMLRIAAMRFWLSRLWSVHHPKEGELTFQKNPDDFKNILLARISEKESLSNLW